MDLTKITTEQAINRALFLDKMQDLIRLRIVEDFKFKLSQGISREEARKLADLAGGKRLKRIINRYSLYRNYEGKNGNRSII